MSAFWDRARAEAFKLPPDELLRHARVSSDNKHECRECFTCACLAEYKRRCDLRRQGYGGAHLDVSPWRLVR